MKKLFFIACIVAIAIVSCVESPINKVYLPSDTNIRYVGRVVMQNDTVRFTYPGTAIATAFEGERIFMDVKPNCGSFVVEVDDQPAHKITIGDTTRVLLADSLAWRPHTLRITYVVEGYELKPEFCGFVVDGNLCQVRQEFLPTRTIEFIGNSITCGYGVESNDPKEGFTYATENHYKTYAAIAARRLNARCRAIARSGIGIYRNYGDTIIGSAEPMPKVYDRTLFGDSTYIFDFASHKQPDVVCVNLGTNDTSLDTYEVPRMRKAYADFVARLRSLYPDAKIVMLTGSMLGGQALTDVCATLDAVVAEAKAVGDENIYRFDMSPQTGDLGYGADYHPSEKQHQKMADELVPFLSEITGW